MQRRRPAIAARLLRCLACCTCVVLWSASTQAARTVHLMPDNPSTFVSADPNDPQYVVALYDVAQDDATAAGAPLAPASLHSYSTIMTDAAGQRYNCSIPGGPPGGGGGALAHKQQQQQQQQSAAVTTKSPFDLLDSLTGLCLYRQDGLWTYEVCHKKHVRQFRQDAAKGKEDFSCGKYAGDEQQTEAVLEDASSSGHYIKYVSHTFGGGADCVLTGGPRTAEVRYTCERDTKENVVLSVREFPSCNYVVVVSTPFLCRHPAFAPRAPDVRLVGCTPLEGDGDGGSGSVGGSSSRSSSSKSSGGGGGDDAPKAAGPDKDEL